LSHRVNTGALLTAHETEVSVGMQCLQVFIEEERSVAGDAGEAFIWQHLLQTDGTASTVAQRLGTRPSGWNFLHDAARFGQMDMVRCTFARILHIAHNNTQAAPSNALLERLSKLLLQQNRFGSMP